MNARTKRMGLMVGLSIGISTCLSAACYADTTTTTTIIRQPMTTSTVVTLPDTGSFIVVDPLTGEIRGVFDPVTRMLNGQLVPGGLIVADRLSGRMVAVVDTSGNLVDVTSTAASDPLVLAIDTRMADLNRQIADALTNGRLTGTQAAPLRAELDRITAEELAAKQSAGVVTFAEAYPIAIELNTLGDRVAPIIGATVPAALIAHHFVVVNGQTCLVDDFAFRKVELTRKIDDEYTAGRLAGKQKEYLKGQLDEISARESRYREHGDLTDSKRRMLSQKYDKVQAMLDKDIAMINDKRARIGLKVN